ncbi:TRPM8 channel-associated factor homolog, partial [Ascaphus truei]|uniref:TRPM8 channel-associated factor homolog n=1 Tax=Ascaphus truei TaxID=8439 RepID=UPI003F5955F3
MGEKTLSAQTAYTSLVAGVEALDFSHVIPCILQLTADKAFPLLVNTAGEVLIAASQYGRGKIVVLPNEECLTTPTFFPFLQNAVNWLKPSTVSQVGVQSMFASLAEFFTSKGHKVQLQTSFSNTCEVYCRNADEDSQSVELISFIKGGGGLLIAGQTRSWSSKNNQDVFSSYPGNKVAGVTGIHFSASFSQTGVFPFLKEIPISPFMAVNEINFLPHIESLLNDISKFRLKLSGTASELLVHGGNAFSLTQGDKLQAPMAAALYGRGRVVVMTHEQMLTVPNLKHFTRNALSWLDAGRKGDIGLTKTLLAFYNLLLSENLDMKFKLTDLTPSLSVFCCDSYHEQDVEKILEFVAEGGGLLVAGQAWYWSSVNQDKEAMADYPGNKMLNRMGISILGSYCSIPDSYNALNPKEISASYHFRKTFSQLQQHLIKNEAPSETLIPWIHRMMKDFSHFSKISFEHSLPCSAVQETCLQLFSKYTIPEPSKENPIKNYTKEACLVHLRSLLYEKYADSEACKVAGVEPFPVSPGSLIENILLDGDNKGHTARSFHDSEKQYADRNRLDMQIFSR